MMVPNHSNDTNFDALAYWSAAYDAPTLPMIEALAGLSGAKEELHSSCDKESRTVLALPGL